MFVVGLVIIQSDWKNVRFTFKKCMDFVSLYNIVLEFYV